MNSETIKSLFPLKAKVTQEIIKKANISISSNCIGALTLKSVLPEDLHRHIHWGCWNGVYCDLLNYIEITTENGADFMDMTKETDVVFILGHTEKNH